MPATDGAGRGRSRRILANYGWSLLKGSLFRIRARLPPKLRQFPPFFLMQPGKTMRLDEKAARKTPIRHQIQSNLGCKLWLDFGGKGYTVEDGMNRKDEQKLATRDDPPQRLGRVAIPDIDQVITHDLVAGVEIRQAQLRMEADSRIDGTIGRLPVVGRDHDFQLGLGAAEPAAGLAVVACGREWTMSRRVGLPIGHCSNCSWYSSQDRSFTGCGSWAWRR